MVDATEFTPYLLGALRGLGLVVFLPLGWDLVSITQRLALTIGFALGVPVDSASGYSDWLRYLIAGMLVGAPFALVTDLAAAVGELIDAARGITIAEILDPLQSSTSSHLSVLSRYAVWICFLSSGGTAHLIELVSKAEPIALPSVQDSGAQLLGVLALACSAAFALVVPALLLFLACEICIGLLTKVSSGTSFSTEATILKLIVFTVFATQCLSALDMTSLVGIISG